MKRIIFLLLGCFAMLSNQVSAQVTLKFPSGNIASQEWVNSQIKAKIDSFASALKAPVRVIEPPVVTPNIPIVTQPTTPSLVNCERGPTIRNITNIESTGLLVLFDGKGVEGLDYTLLGPVYEIIAQGSFKPSSNLFNVGYKNLPPGNYHLTISANTCIGRDSKDITINRK